MRGGAEVGGINKILFTTDFSEISNHALPYAIKLAKTFKAELVMLHAVTLYEHDPNDPNHRFPSLRSYCTELRQDADSRFQVCIDRIGDIGVKVRKAVVQGISPHAAILDFLNEESGFGMIVMSTHGRSGLSHVLIGSVTENVLRYAPCPVFVVKNPEHEFIDPKTGDVHLRKILFPLDFSKDSILPVDLLSTIARAHGSDIIVYHAIDAEIPPVYYTAGIESVLQLDPELYGRVEKKMRDLIGKSLDGLTVSYRVAEGRAVGLIRTFARENEIDLIVMGAAGSHGIGDFLFGSTASRVIQKAVCPVLVA
jgi:nucleotide-binding universal stress UspA family protein